MPYGNPDPAHPIKFVKALISPSTASLTTQQGARFFFKLVYEFWGFCVNGTPDVLNPGGLSSLSGTAFPSGFDSGSNTLLATGIDGATGFGGSVFSSGQVNFTALNTTGSLVNKYLTMWKPDDPSSDDSVYRIIGVDDSSHIRLDVQTGGTTRLGGKAYFSDRSGIRFRVFDAMRVVSLPGWEMTGFLSQSLIMNFAAAPNVNPGQAVSQLKLDLTASQAQVRMTVSPSGSWNGSAFTDASSAVTQTWFSGGSSGKGIFFLIGGRDFLIAHLKGEDTSWNANTIAPGFHIEVPQRLYPPMNDTNPMAWFMWTNSGGASGLSPTTGSYGSGFKMVCQDNVTRDWITLARCPTGPGERVHYALTPASGGLWYGLTLDQQQKHGSIHFNAFSSSYLTTDALLMQSGSLANQQYSFARARLRRVRFTGRNLKPNMRLGERWIHVGGGVLWPWDGSELPFGLFWEGGGAQPGEFEG